MFHILLVDSLLLSYMGSPDVIDEFSLNNDI